MPLYAVGLNHRTAPLEVRERLAFPSETVGPALDAIKAATGASESALLSTCNRTEIYLNAPANLDIYRLGDWLATHPAAKGLDLKPHLYSLCDEAVTRHAFRVASGLDSMVLGEPQILGQVKHAVKLAQDAGTMGGPLDRLFQETFRVAKEVRSQTAIGAASVSMAAAALKLAEQVFGDLKDSRMLLIGAGEMIELTASHFAARQPKTIVVANRTVERGAALAEKFSGSAIALPAVPERLHEFDIVISCTASTLPLVGKGMVERALKARRHRPMFMVDLAVPRDIEAEVGDLDDVFLYSLDSLGKIIEQNAGKRAAAVAEADVIIDRCTRDFNQWLESRSATPFIQSLRSRADQYRRIELEKAARRLAKGEDPVAVMEALASGISGKFLHHPLSALQRTQGAERSQLIAMLEKIYPDQEEP